LPSPHRYSLLTLLFFYFFTRLSWPFHDSSGTEAGLTLLLLLTKIFMRHRFQFTVHAL
jgi:hypothetical protein